MHWLLTGLPLALMAPVLGIMLSLPAGSYGVLALSLALGTASLSLIGAIGAALTVGLAKGGVLLSLLVLPLYIPVLILGRARYRPPFWVMGWPLTWPYWGRCWRCRSCWHPGRLPRRYASVLTVKGWEDHVGLYK